MMKRKIFSAIAPCLLAMTLCACTQEATSETLTAETAVESSQGASAEETQPEESSTTETYVENTDLATETATETSGSETSAIESEIVSESASETESATASETVPASILEGEFTGWADNHTVEVYVEGVPTAFMVEDEEVKTILESLEEGTTFSFEMIQEGEVRKITEVIQK